MTIRIMVKNPNNGRYEDIGEMIYDDFISDKEGGRRFVLCSILQKLTFLISKKEDVYYEVNGSRSELYNDDWGYFQENSKPRNYVP